MTFVAQTSDTTFLSRARHICQTKAAHETRAEATTCIKRGGFIGQPYHCPWCDYWHTTTMDRATAKAFRRRLSRLMRSPPESAQPIHEHSFAAT